MRMRSVVLLGCWIMASCQDDPPVGMDGDSTTSGTTGPMGSTSTAPASTGPGPTTAPDGTADGTTTSLPGTTDTGGTTSGATDSGSSSSGGTTMSLEGSGTSTGTAGESSGEESSGSTGMGGDMCTPAPSDLDLLCGDGMLLGGELCYETVPPLQSAGTFATRVWAGDLDDDMDPDALILVEFPANMTVLLNDGLGNLVFDDTYTLAPGADTGMNDVAVGDMDGDTWVDAVVAFGSPPALRVLSNDGGGAFGFPQATPLALDPRAVGVADFDGDGNNDAVVADDVGVTVHYGLGNGTFGMAMAQSDPALVDGRDLAIEDFDGDGELDVAVAYSQTVAVYLGDGLGGLSAPWTLAVPVSPFGPQDMAVGDVTVDGIPDILVADNQQNEVHTLEGVGDGTFLLLPMPRDGSFVVVGEGNSDCESDIYSRTTPAMFDELTIYPSDGMGGFDGPELFLLHSGMVDMEGADFDGDTLTDILFAIGPTGDVGVAFSDP